MSAASPPRLLSLTPSVSSDDSSSSDYGSAPASPRSAQPPPPPPPYHAAISAKTLSLLLAPHAVDEPSAPRSHSPTSSAPSRPPARTTAPPVARPAISLEIESLLNEKRTMLASFEEKFNEKILSRHEELVEEQRRSRKSDDENGPLAEEVRRLRDELEEQKFSHEVELSLQKKKVEKLEKELKQVGPHQCRREPPSIHADKRVKELEDELRREKSLRIDQLKSLEQLHFAEFRQVEKRHAEFVSEVVSSYQEEVKILKKKMKAQQKLNMTDRKVSTEQRESSETAAAAAALSSLAGSSAAGQLTGPFRVLANAKTNHDSPATGGSLEMPHPSVAKSPPKLKRRFSEVSDLSSIGSDGDVPKWARPPKKAKSSRRGDRFPAERGQAQDTQN